MASDPQRRESDRVAQNVGVLVTCWVVTGCWSAVVGEYHLPWFVWLLGIGTIVLLGAAGRNP